MQNSKTEHNAVKETKTQKTRRKLVESAFECFSEKGIEMTSISDVANKAGYGEATIYRYFTNKENLALECGMRFWKMADGYYEAVALSPMYEAKSGLDQVDAMLLTTMQIFTEHRMDFKFLLDLDVFLVSHRVGPEKLKEYEACVNGMSAYLCTAIEKGKTDGSILCGADTEEIYYTLTHTFLSLLQKLSGLGKILSSDQIIGEKRRMTLLIDLLLAGLASKC